MFKDFFDLFIGFFHLGEFKDDQFFYDFSFEIIPIQYDPGDVILN